LIESWPTYSATREE